MAPWNFGRDVMDRWADTQPAQPALYFARSPERAETLSFHEFRSLTNRLASRLRAQGIDKGDRILVVVGKDPAFWPLMVALNKLGAVPMPGTTQLTPKDVRYRLEAADASRVIATPEVAWRLEGASDVQPLLTAKWVVGSEGPASWTKLDAYHETDGDPTDAGNPTDEDDPCLIYFTSGTTGHAKMVLHKQTYPRGHRTTGVDWIGLKPGDIHWNLSDTGWAKAAWSSLFGPWMAGATVVVDALTGKFDARAMLDILASHPITSLCAAPTIYRLVVQENLANWKFPHLVSAVGAGEPLNPEVIETFRRHTGLTIRDGYGQTETVLLVGNRPGMAVKPGSMGLPAPGFDIDIIDDAGNRLPPGREGDIAVYCGNGRPEGLFVEYWRDPEETARRHVGPWYITGDRGVKDEDGYFWFVGRADDVIISAGYRIGPFEVESALVEHPAVVEAAVVAAPDATRGAIVKAYVVLRPDVTPSPALAEELQEHVKQTTAPYKYPRLVEFVPDLPKTISGKIRRVELREPLWRREA